VEGAQPQCVDDVKESVRQRLAPEKRTMRQYSACSIQHVSKGESGIAQSAAALLKYSLRLGMMVVVGVRATNLIEFVENPCNICISNNFVKN
jgi:hypothetical protein